MSIASFIRRLLLAADRAVTESFERAHVQEVPLGELLEDREPCCPTCDEAEEEVGDDTLALFGDSAAEADVYSDEDREDDIKQVRGWLREMVAAHVAREESAGVEREWFDLSHDARTGGAA